MMHHFSSSTRYAILVLLVVAACAQTNDTVEITIVYESPTPIRILALGDSYTVGEQVGKLESWPAQLIRKLRTSGRGTAEPSIVAVSGWDTGDLIRGLSIADLAGPYDVVTLQIGVNNQFRNGSPANFESDLTELTNSAVQLAAGDARRVVLISVPDWGATPFAEGAPRDDISSEIDGFNSIIRSQAISSGTRFVDITEISRRASRNLDLISDDGLHPSAEMYTAWVDVLFPPIEEIVDAPM